MIVNFTEKVFTKKTAQTTNVIKKFFYPVMPLFPPLPSSMDHRPWTSPIPFFSLHLPAQRYCHNGTIINQL